MTEKGDLKRIFLLTVTDKENQETDLIPVTENGELILDPDGEECYSGYLIRAEHEGKAHGIASRIPYEKIPLDYIDEYNA